MDNKRCHVTIQMDFNSFNLTSHKNGTNKILSTYLYVLKKKLLRTQHLVVPALPPSVTHNKSSFQLGGPHLTTSISVILCIISHATHPLLTWTFHLLVVFSNGYPPSWWIQAFVWWHMLLNCLFNRCPVKCTSPVLHNLDKQFQSNSWNQCVFNIFIQPVFLNQLLTLNIILLNTPRI